MKHISLDFWNTVGKPNPQFAQARADLLASRFHILGSEARAIYTKVKRDLDHRAETHGEAPSRGDNLSTLFRAITKETGSDVLVDLDPTQLRHFENEFAFELDSLFRRYPPTVDIGLIDTMRRINQRGITFSIGSNTNFITGAEIIQQIRALPFTFYIFSDVISVSKPDKLFYEHVANNAAHFSNVHYSDIVHVGDNMICDGGAVDFGMQFAYTESADHTAAVLETLMTETVA